MKIQPGSGFFSFGVIMIFLLLAGCISQSPAPPSAAGVWIATLETNGGTQNDAVKITLEGEQTLTGTWESNLTGETLPVSGVANGSSITITYEVESDGRLFVVTIRGTVRDETIRGEAVIQSGGRVFGTMGVTAVRQSASAFNGRSTVPPGFQGTAEQRLGDALDGIAAGCNCPGIAAAVRTATGDEYRAAVGYSDLDAMPPMTPDSRMPAGSIGKMFTAALTLMVFQDRGISLDAPISTWLGNADWFGELPNSSEITVRHLLSHASGIADHVDDADFIRDASAAVTENGGDMSAFTPERLIGYVLDNGAAFEPGTGYLYTDTGYVLIGLILEAITGESYYDLLTRRILVPQDLSDTEPLSKRTFDRLATGYPDPTGPAGFIGKTADAGTLRLDLGVDWTAGGLLSSATDLARFVDRLFTGQIVPAELVNAMTDTGGDSDGYGLGVRVVGHGARRSYGHTGDAPGYRTAVAYFPDSGLSVAIQFNTDYGIDSGNAIAQIVRAMGS